MTDLQRTDLDSAGDRDAVELDGGLYFDSIGFQLGCRSSAVVEYNLASSWEELHGVLGVMDNATSSDLVIQFTIAVDGQEVFSEPATLGNPLPVTVDVADALRVRVEARLASGRSDANCFTAEAAIARPLVSRGAFVPSFEPDANGGVQPDAAELLLIKTLRTDLSRASNIDIAEIGAEQYFDSIGFRFGCGSESAVEYNLSRDWQTLAGVVAIMNNASSSDLAVRFTVLVDGVTAFEETVSLGQPLPVSVAVEGALRVRVEARLAGGTSDANCFTSEAAFATPMLSKAGA